MTATPDPPLCDRCDRPPGRPSPGRPVLCSRCIARVSTQALILRALADDDMDPDGDYYGGTGR